MCFLLFQKGTEKDQAEISRLSAKTIEDYKKAEALNKPKALGGDPEAAYFMGFLAKEGLSTSSDRSALEWYLLAASAGNKKAMYELGKIFEIKFDYKQAIPWYFKAANTGVGTAHLALADIYLNGKGISVEVPLGIKHMQTAADLGEKIAQFNLAKFYDEGLYLEQDKEQASKWYQKAADSGMSAALAVLKENKKRCLYFEKVITQNQADACLLAQNKTDKNIAIKISDLYYDGKFIKKDPAKSLFFLQRALELGRVDAALMLSKRYQEDTKIKDNRTKSYAYWLIYEHKKRALSEELTEEEKNYEKLVSNISFLSRLRAGFEALKEL